MRSSDWSSDVCSSDLNAVWQMKEDIVPNGGWKFDHLLAYRQAEVAHTAPLAKDERFPIFPPYAVQQIRDAMPDDGIICLDNGVYKIRSEEHTSELQSLMRISYAVFCLKKKKKTLTRKK